MTYRLEGLQHRYGQRLVLDIADFEVQPGEILAVVGPSGAGKSTLLRLLNFLEPATKGSILYDGRPAGPDSPLPVRRQVTTVFQQPLLLRRSVIANIRFGQRLRGDDIREVEISRLIERLGLAELADGPARTLSAGEAQRVAVARALATDPRVLLLDEPTGNLDPYNTGLIEEIVLEENLARATTTVIVTHDVFQARRLAHRTALMIGGRIVEVSATETFFNQPTEAATAAFLRGELVY